MAKTSAPPKAAGRTIGTRVAERTGSGPTRAASTKPKRDRASVPEDFKTSMLNIRVKDELKTKANAVLADIGISLPEAVRVFLGRVVSERAFPFPLEVPNAETTEALREARSGTVKRFTSVEEMFDDLESGGRR